VTYHPDSILKLDCGLDVEIVEIKCQPLFAHVLVGTHSFALETATLAPAWHMKPYVPPITDVPAAPGRTVNVCQELP
jgi:hypothetical protein